MQYRSRKLLSLLLAVLMIVSLLPSAAFADEIDETPIEEVVEEVEETPVEETPVEETPVEETPVEETSVEETPVEETPVEETPVEETPVEETPVEETPVEETPVEETPVEEAPVEETPVEETPVEEPEVDEAVAAVQALINALPDVSALEGLSADELVALDTQAGDAYDAYYELSEAQQAQITGLDNLLALLDYFTTLVTVEEETTDFVVYVDEQGYDSLDSALEAVKNETGEVTVKITGKVEFAGSIKGDYSKITFEGEGDSAEISSTTTGGFIESSSAIAVVFDSLKLSRPNGNYVTDGGHAGYYFTVHRAGSVAYNNCSFPDGACAAGTTTYTSCSFGRNKSVNDGKAYSLWVYGDSNNPTATCKVSNCTFTSNRCVKLYEEGTEKNAKLTIENTTFNTDADDSCSVKPAIVLTRAESVTLSGNTYAERMATFELETDEETSNGTIIKSDETVTCICDQGGTNVNCGVLVSNEDGTAKIYRTVAAAAEAAQAGDTVTLLANTDEEVTLPEGVTLERGGFTADNVTETTTQPVEVGDYASLKAALGEGKSVKLTADIDFGPADNSIQDTLSATASDATIDLNNHAITLVCEDLFITSNLTIQNGEIKLGTIRGTGGSGLLRVGSFSGENENLTVTLDDITINAEDYNSRYAIFSINDGNTLNIKNSNITLNNDLSVNSNNEPNGGFVKADTTSAKLNIESSEITLTNVSRAVVYTTTTVTSSTITVTGDGTDEKMEHGFNGTTLTVTNSTITMEGLHGRGFTSYNNANTLTINGASTVSFTNCGEGAIMAKEASTTITVDAASTLTADTVVCNGDYTVTVTSGEDTETIESATEAPALKVENGTVTVTEKTYVAQIGATKYETLADAFAAAQSGETIELLKDVELTSGVSTIAQNITFNGNSHTISASFEKGDDGEYSRTDVVITFGSTTNKLRGTITVENLTIQANAAKAIFVPYASSSDSFTLNNVTVTGDYWDLDDCDQCSDMYAVHVNGPATSSFNNSELAGVFVSHNSGNTHAQATLTNTTVGTLLLDEKVDATTSESSISNLVCMSATISSDIPATNVYLSSEDEEGNDVYVTPAAQIDDILYATLADAFAAAQSGETIDLLKDVALTKGITITTGGITFDGNNHKLTGDIKNLGGWDCVVLNYESSAATAGAKITDLTINMTAVWGIHFNGSGTTCPELNNVTVEGTYTAPFGLYLRNNGGAKLTNCNIVSMFTNSGRSSDNDKLTLDGTHIDTLFVNTTTATTTKVFVNDTGDTKSSVGALYLADDSTMRLDSSAQSLSTEENTTYSVFYNGEVKQYVAKIGNNYYFSLEKAVAAAQTSDTITLLRDFTVTETTEIPSTISNLTIEGNGHTITADNSNNDNLRVFNFVNSKNPTIRNLKITGSAYYGIELNGCGQSTLENVTVEGEYYKWNDVPLALYVQNTGGASLKDCSFVGVGKNGNGLISETNDQRLKLDSTTIEKLYVNTTKVVYEDVVYLAEGEEHTSKINTICCGDYSSIRVSAALCERAGSILLNSYDESVLFVSPAAKIDTVYYSTLSDAVAALEDSETLTLLEDIEVNADNKDKNRIKLESLKGVTIDGNGKIFTVDLDGNSYCLMFTGTTDLTVKDLTITGEVNYAIFIKSCVNTTLENVKVDTTSNGLGDDDNVYAVTFNYTGGGTLKNCEINGVFKNGEGVTANGTDGRLKLENSTIGNLYVHYTKGDGYLNKENLTAGANDKSEIKNLILGYGDTSRVSYDVTKNANKIVTAVALVTYANNSTEAFFTLPEAVAAVEGKSAATITLLRDATGAGVVFENENKVGKHNNLTIDFNGFTYTVTGPSVGSTKTETNAFQILEGNTVTLKNGKLTCTATSESGCKRLIQNYANLTLEDMEFDGTSISDPDNKVYALSFCCGTVKIIGNTSITANGDAVAFDSDQYSTYDAPVVTVNTTGTITGDVAVTGGTLNISNGTFNGRLSKSAGTIAISGGTFATEIQDDWCAEGFEPVALSDGTYSVQVETAKTGEAAIGSKVYATFAEALEAAKTDYETNGTISNIQILAAVTVSDAIGFPVNIVNIGGYAITGEIKAADGYILTSMGSLFYMIVVDTNKKVASVGEKSYNSLQEALNAAAESTGDKTVTLLEDVNDSTVYIIDEGVTLDLGTHSLTAKALNGDGSVTGTAYNDQGGYAKLTVDSLILATQAPKTTAGDESYDTLPVYDPSEECYVFTLFKVFEQPNCLEYDGESDKLSYSFGRQLTGLVRKSLLSDGASDNKLSIEVHVSWTDESGNTVTTIYDYKDSHVSQVMSDDNNKVFGLILNGLRALELSSGATVQAVVKADSGVTTCGEQHTITF